MKHATRFLRFTQHTVDSDRISSHLTRLLGEVGNTHEKEVAAVARQSHGPGRGKPPGPRRWLCRSGRQTGERYGSLQLHGARNETVGGF